MTAAKVQQNFYPESQKSKYKTYCRFCVFIFTAKMQRRRKDAEFLFFTIKIRCFKVEE